MTATAPPMWPPIEVSLMTNVRNRLISNEPMEVFIGFRVTVTEQAERLDKLMVEIAELTARVGSKPRNSSKPPSSEGYTKPAPKSRRVRSGNKPGKQTGTPGKHLPRRDTADQMATHIPHVCAGCGHSLDEAPVVGEVSRQVLVSHLALCRVLNTSPSDADARVGPKRLASSRRG